MPSGGQELPAVPAALAPGLKVVVRIALDETESFYLGDWFGIRSTYLPER